ncbi:rhodanese-like domain-containing protein [Acidimangrovimonas pyrenivorans]|uniref:Rhodanese-like domain-containing protein n=1 Tax=Acidimangrovimonas pyrenivorans TaxID=2030798 RepID=A0ABV7ADL2_9RHOB
MFSFLKPSGPRVERINPADAVAKAAAGEMTVIDVRDASEIRASGKAKGALHIPMVVLQSKADPSHPEHDKNLKTDKPVALYCASGARSQMAGQLMLRLGYGEVYNIGGLGDWRAAGGKVVR